MNILLTNDDGIYSKGLLELKYILEDKFNVTIVTTDRDRSSAAHSLTFHRPLRIKQIEQDIYVVDGTPADSVLVALKKIFKKPPDVIISGINDGANLGEDVLYSGTVAAAFEGSINKVKSFAISLVVRDGIKYFKTASHFALEVLNFIMKYDMPNDTILNINVPNLPLDKIKDIQFTKQGSRRFFDNIEEHFDPRGKPYYWIWGNNMVLINHDKGTDYWAIDNGYVSITPIKIDFTNYVFLDHIRSMWDI